MRNATENVAAAALLGGAALALYAATLSRHPSADSLEFALAVESGDPRQLLNLHHPLLHPLGWGFVEVWRVLGWTGGALLPLQLLNALGGGVAAAFLAHLASRLTGSARIGCMVAAGFAVSGAMWLLSTEAEFVTPPLAVNLGLLDLLITAAPERWERPAFSFGLGAAIAIAALLYLTNGILLPVAALAARSRSGFERGIWLRRVALLSAGAIAGLTLSGAALIVWLHAAGASRLPELMVWSRYGGLDWSNLPRGAYAFIRSLLLYPGLGMNDRTTAYLNAAGPLQRTIFAAYYGLAAALAALPVWWAVRQRRLLLHTYGRAVVLVLVWAGAHTLFALYWVPSDCSFWAPTLAAWWLVIALLAAATPHSRRTVSYGTALAAALLLVNAVLFVLPHHDLQRNRTYWIAHAAAQHTAPGDVIITRSDDVLALYLMYFERRSVVLADRNPTAAIEEALALARRRHGRAFAVDVPAAAENHFAISASWQAAGVPVWELRAVPSPPPTQ